ncbi:hypothetical protein A2V49_04195 [candidate division WWE3 bacterium RBG_19FT_COMBO_34_6]|uniref:UDP-N-acetylglucosamine kinase n=1 Tax=candidate division WWE3 bacterium RBG_19FT_COMBO_34_6 TaxID=1802612 RepID=A0A1F4ULQ0_UNCKA|nr:MAG: hypothetical protein A2V49_04195 [candidate division WWE3 bacterium RBG_19FT_COMBO_34_6]
MNKNFLLLIRGKPASGKSTVIRYIKDLEFRLLDPDLIKNNKEYKKFSPRMTKNPTENIKRYCYLYNKAEKFLLDNQNVIWVQPWSRMAEIELTIRNFGYYLLDLKEKSWTESLDEIIKKLPFIFLIAEIDTDNEKCFQRFYKRFRRLNKIKNLEEERLKKTSILFQKLTINIISIILDGNVIPKENATRLVAFIKNSLID